MSNKLINFPRVDYTGKTFDRLTVISFDEYKLDSKNRRSGFWNVECICGNKKSVKQNSLITKAVRSCGCLLDDFRKEKLPTITKNRNSLEDGVALFNNLYSNYRYRAIKVLKIEFNLTAEEFKVLINKTCFYCGEKPIQNFIKKKANGTLLYNGLDRIDNNKGYFKENVVSCCEICNKAKRTMSLQEFINWIKKISKHGSKINFNYKIPN